MAFISLKRKGYGGDAPHGGLSVYDTHRLDQLLIGRKGKTLRKFILLPPCSVEGPQANTSDDDNKPLQVTIETGHGEPRIYAPKEGQGDA